MKKLLLLIMPFIGVIFFAQDKSDSLKYKIFGVGIKPEVLGSMFLHNCEPSELITLESSEFLDPSFFLIEDYILCKTTSTPILYFKILNGPHSYYVKTTDVEMADKDKSPEDAMVYFSTMDAVTKWEYDKHFKELLETRSKGIQLNNKISRVEKALAYLDSFDKYGIGITDAVPYGDYGMTGARFRIYNASKKAIKYITFNFYGRNAVKDKVVIYGKSSYSKKGIGPIEANDFASYEFDTVWLTDIVQTLTLTSVNILYMNGTSKTVAITDAMWIDEEELEPLYEAD